ncbi:MAG: M48 family metalloprotease [Deltaproteobacteria bacterium]|jgi:Zn-dependent protease with chaperone function|nr:M48 family metalloprotease [Deltaproteobacteria bacterium]
MNDMWDTQLSSTVREVLRRFLIRPFLNIVGPSRNYKAIFTTVFSLFILFYAFCVYKIVQLLNFILSVESLKQALAWSKLPFFRLEYWPLAAGIFFAVITIIVSLKKSLELTAGDGSELIERIGGLKLGQRYSYEAPFGQKQQQALEAAANELAAELKIPKPKLYILPWENSVNSLSCGLTPETSAVAFTNGVMAYLNQEELYALAAYEFLRIKKGATALQTRLLSRLYGFFFISLTGRWLTHGRHWQWVPWVGEIVLRILGGIGFWLGSWFQAWYSYGEALAADKSAAAFLKEKGQTVDISRVLEKVLGCAWEGRIKNEVIADLRPLFFVNPVFESWLNCHPPLRERIFDNNPDWKGHREPLMPPNERYLGGRIISGRPRR